VGVSSVNGAKGFNHCLKMPVLDYKLFGQEILVFLTLQTIVFTSEWRLDAPRFWAQRVYSSYIIRA
jgi:hypothetical protein